MGTLNSLFISDELHGKFRVTSRVLAKELSTTIYAVQQEHPKNLNSHVLH